MRRVETAAEANADAHKYTDDGAAAVGMYAALDGVTPDDSKPPELANRGEKFIKTDSELKNKFLKEAEPIVKLFNDCLDSKK
jgi:hypothetical protein